MQKITLDLTPVIDTRNLSFELKPDVIAYFEDSLKAPDGAGEQLIISIPIEPQTHDYIALIHFLSLDNWFELQQVEIYQISSDGISTHWLGSVSGAHEDYDLLAENTSRDLLLEKWQAFVEADIKEGGIHEFRDHVTQRHLTLIKNSRLDIYELLLSQNPQFAE
ncbi:hypothetical protein [Thalassotalea sediminis]|uniref:hypothetical protein n=1 Tax=Thalassotalea sediminis TaxID=1759089 RepID=UPI002573EA0E|nr:hypothetical protein [Thalassotalea sediminis]